MDAAFLDALIEKCSKENRVDGTFITSAYDNVLATLKTSFANHLRKDNLKNRPKILKNHFGVCYDLFHNLSRFSWNLDTKLFTAEPEVWVDLIKTRPDAKKWITQGNHKGSKRKAPMSGLFKADMERMSKEQIQVAKIQAQAVEKGITFLE
ncbi:hypothetical protein AHAS_Ahas14G0074700 [Arachis hypogaea]